MKGVVNGMLSCSMPFTTNKKNFILSVPESVIRKAPGVDRNIWGPDKIDLRWLSEAARHYGCVPYWET